MPGSRSPRGYFGPNGSRELSAKNFIAGVTIPERGTKVGKVTASAAATVYTRSADCYGRDHICAWLEVAGGPT